MIKKFSLLLYMLVFLAAAPGAAAQLLPGGAPITLDDIYNIIVTVVEFLLVAGGLVATAFIIWGGVTYMAAGANQTKVAEAQKRMKSGLIGALIIFGVFVILETLYGVVTGEFFFGGSRGPTIGNKGPGASCSVGLECRSGRCETRPTGVGRVCR